MGSKQVVSAWSPFTLVSSMLNISKPHRTQIELYNSKVTTLATYIFSIFWFSTAAVQAYSVIVFETLFESVLGLNNTASAMQITIQKKNEWPGNYVWLI